MEKERLLPRCRNCAQDSIRGQVICPGCISTFRDAVEVRHLRLIDAAARLKVLDVEPLEQLVSGRKFTEIQSHKQLFELPPGGWGLSPQTRMNPDLLTLSLGSVRTHRAVTVSSEWCYHSILDVVRAHLPQAKCENADIYLNAVAFFLHIAGRYAAEVGGDVFRNWLLGNIVSAWIRDQAVGRHPESVNYSTSAILQGNLDLNIQLGDFIQNREGSYAEYELVTGTLLQDSIGEDTLIASFQKSVAASINAIAIDEVAVIRFMVRRVMTGILEQPWLYKSVSDAVSES